MSNNKWLTRSNISFILLVCIFSLLSACSNNKPPVKTQTPTVTATVTPTVTITFTPSITPTKSYPEWPIVYFDSFDDTHRNWIVDKYTDEYLSGIFSIIDGRYIVNVTAKKMFYSHFRLIKNQYWEVLILVLMWINPLDHLIQVMD